MTILGVAGLLLQGLGLAVAFVGIRRTWNQFAPPGDGLVDPVIRRLEAPVIGLQRRWDRLRGKRQQGASLAGAVVATASIKARARIVSGPIPETADAREAIRTLDRRVRALETVVADTQEGFDDKLEDVQREVVDLRTDLADAKTELSERDRLVATDGLRLELVGLGMVFIGLACTGLDQLLRSV